MDQKQVILEQYARQHKTDKLEHGYLPYYVKHLPETVTNLLEIGVAKGASALMWNDWYGREEVDIHLIDLFLNPDFVTPRWCRNRGFVPHQGNQSDTTFLNSIKTCFDVIIDDGSHNASDMWMSFKALFLNNLSPGGLYVIEDLHCCKDEHYWDNTIGGLSDTILGAFQDAELHNSVEVALADTPFFNAGEAKVFENLIDRFYVYQEKIIFIYRKK
jgi:hypothetical protein